MVDASPTSTGNSPEKSQTAAPLDEVMLAMDVVDTLRHADKMVERELSSDERDSQLKSRLRQIYASQGIDVSDRVLNDGVNALREDRFVYDPPGSGFGRWWAMIWIQRDRWGKFALIGLLLLVATGVGYQYLVKLPAERAVVERATELEVGLPQRFEEELQRIKALTRETSTIDEAESLAAQGLVAAEAGDLDASRDKAETLQQLRVALDQEYIIRIVSRPDQPSGVFRIPSANPNARNYYLIVEAVDVDGQPVPISITSEEDGTTSTVRMWGQRVDDQTFASIRADKSDDGIIQNNVLGVKRRGARNPEYALPVREGAILKW
jgi:hypothetical protein